MKRREFLKTAAGIAGAMASGAGLLTWTSRAQAATISKTFYITEGFITQITGVDIYHRGFSASTASFMSCWVSSSSICISASCLILSCCMSSIAFSLVSAASSGVAPQFTTTSAGKRLADLLAYVFYV